MNTDRMPPFPTPAQMAAAEIARLFGALARLPEIPRAQAVRR